MFKKLVQQIAAIKSVDDRNTCFGAINFAFERNKISWDDHELLYDLAAMVRVSGAPACDKGDC